MYEKERESIAQVVDDHASAPLLPEFSTPVARLIARRCATLKIKSPLVIRRFLDRSEGPNGDNGVLDKLSRDFYSKEYQDLTPKQQEEMTSRRSALAYSNPAEGHPYTKPGFTFAQGHNLLLATYREDTSRFPGEVRAAMIDFRNALEKDLDEAAKHAGFFKQYSDANTALKIATAGPHRATQTIPIVSKGA